MFSNGCLSDSKHESATRCHGDAERVALAMHLTVKAIVLSVVAGIHAIGERGDEVGTFGKEVERQTDGACVP